MSERRPLGRNPLHRESCESDDNSDERAPPEKPSSQHQASDLGRVVEVGVVVLGNGDAQEAAQRLPAFFRFEHGLAPLGWQLDRGIRQVFLDRMNV